MFEDVCDYCAQPSPHCYVDEDGYTTCPDCHAMFTMGQEQPEYNEEEDE